MSTVEKVFAECYPTREIVTGDAYTSNSLTSDNTITNADVENDIKAALKWNETYTGYNITVVVQNVSAVSTTALPCAKVTIENNEDSSDKTEKTLNFPVTVITASAVAGAIGDISLDTVQNALPTGAGATEVADTINRLLPIILEDNDTYKDYVSNGKYSLNATAVLAAQDETEQTYDITFTLGNKKLGATNDTITWNQKLTISKTSTETDLSKAEDLILEKLDNSEFEVASNINISAGADADAVNDEVTKAVKNLLLTYGYQFNASDNATGNKTFRNISVAGEKIYSEGKWTGTVTIQDTRSTSESFTLNLNLVKKEAKVIENIEILDSKKEVEIKSSSKVEDTLAGVKLTYSDGSTKSVAASEMSANGITWDENTFNGKQLGTYTITLYAESGDTKVSDSYDVTVVDTVDVDGKSATIQTVFGVNDFALKDVQSISSNNSEVAEVSLVKNSSGDVTNIKIKALKAGTTILTVVEKDGTTWTKNYIVNADGTTSSTAAAQEVKKGTRYIWNTPEKLGFTATSYELSELTSEGQESGVITIEESELDGTPVFTVTPSANGNATLTFKGGDKENLSVSYNVQVTDTSITITKDKNNYDSTKLLLNDSAERKIDAYKYDASYDGTIDVADLGFDENDKIIFQDTTGSVVDTVNASELTEVKVNGTSGKITLTYGNNTPIEKSLVISQKITPLSVENTIDKFGLIAVDGVITDIKNNRPEDTGRNIVNAEIKKNTNGESILYVTPGKDTDGTTKSATITLTDKLGNEAKVTVTVNNNKIGQNPTIEAFKGYADYSLDKEKSSYVFDLGEEISFGDAIIKNSAGQSIALTNEMITVDGKAFSTQEATVGKDNTVVTKKADLTAYGNMDPESEIFTVCVRPAYETLTASDLDIPSTDSVKSVSVGGDTGIIASVSNGNVKIQANKVNQSSTINVKTTNGNTVAVEVTVDESGTISTDIVKDFRSTFTTITNNEDTLGFIANAVDTSNEDIAIAKLAGDRITIHSVAPGKASIYAKNGDQTTTIFVTVDEFGTVTVDNIVKATDNGFVRGEAITEGEYAGLDNWYYYIDGEMVTNNWVEVNENGTNVWYHFDKDGKMSRGWIIDESGWKIYNLDSNGRMRKDMWINAAANDALGMPAGLYHLQSDGAVQMNGWAESVTAGIYWYCNAGTGLFEQGNPASWSNSKLW